MYTLKRPYEAVECAPRSTVILHPPGTAHFKCACGERLQFGTDPGALLALIPFGGHTCEIRPSRGAGRVQPPADVHLGMRLPAVMPGTFRACRHRIPLHDRQLPAVALNDEPVV